MTATDTAARPMPTTLRLTTRAIRRVRLTGAAALLALPFGAARAQPADLYPDLGWQGFFFSGPGPVFYPAEGFSLILSRRSDVRLVGGGIAGNVFALYLNGAATPALTTSAVGATDDGADTGALDGDAAWADTRLSRGTVTLDAGNYLLNVRVVRIAGGTTDQDVQQGFIDANATTVPEPDALLLTGAGLAVTVVTATRRRRG